MPQTLMGAKLHKPRAEQMLVARPGLVQRIQASSRVDMTLIVAPAGYGKTTLVTQWAAEADLPVAWFAIDESDNDLVRFLSYLVAAIQAIYPDACPHLLGLLDRSPLPEPERLAVTLSNDIDALPQRIALVLDDYHWVTDSDIQSVINEFLRHPPRNLHLVLTSRSHPALTLSRLRSNRHIIELHMQDLRLTQAEAAELLTQRTPVALTNDQVNALLTRTEGWAAGLHMAALSLEAQGSIDLYTTDYLLEQVLQQQPPGIRDFLLKTSILERLSPGLAEAVVGSERSSTGITLQALARKGLFLQATDQDVDGSEAWYTVHRIFRTVLRQELEATASPSQVAVLHRRASAWFCASGFYDEAIRHALAAYDTQLAVQIVVDHFTDWLEHGRWRRIEHRLNLLPPDILDRHPWLLMVRAQLLLLQYKWNALLPLLTHAEQRLAEGEYQLSPAKSRLLRCYLDVAWAVYWSSAEPYKAIEAAQRAMPELPISHYYVRGVLQLALTLALQAMGKVELAEQMLEAAVAQAELAPYGSPAPLRPLLCLLSVYFSEGNVIAAAQASRDLLHKAQEAKSLLDQQTAYLAIGAAAYEMNDLEAAVEAFRKGADLRQVGNVRAGHECLVGMALAHHALGRSEDVRATVAALADYHAEAASTVLTAEAISLQRRLGLLNAGFSGRDVVRRSVPARTGIWYGWLEVPAITQVRLALASSQAGAQGRNLAQVDAALEQLLTIAFELHKLGYQAALLALKAILLHRRKQTQAALEVLREAVSLGEERGLMRCIADAGPQLEPLLAQLASIQPSDYLDRLRAACSGRAVKTAQPLQSGTNIAVANLAEPLTRREREVLNLLGQHRTDREIAEALVISPLTVRTHIENLSAKLSVNGRRAIVNRAREYGLLA